MARDEEDRRDAGLSSENEFDRFFGQSHPNQERVGCPSADILKALARKRRGIDDPGYEHLEQCSPCYCEFRAFQRETREVGSRRWIGAAAMLTIMMAGAAIYFVNQRSGNATIEPLAQSRPPETRTVLDLRPFIVTRGDDQAGNIQPLALSRGELEIEILLPIGFEPGNYELSLVDRNLQVTVGKQVVAAMENQVATVHTKIDLRGVAPGAYQLAIRAPGEEWHLYPTKID